MSLQSVIDQSNPNWLILVVFDGLVSDSLYLNSTSNLPVYYRELPNSMIQDDRVCFIHGPSNRQANCGALNRNHAVKFVKTPWIGFLDDDDTVDAQYVDHILRHEKEYPKAMAILFRMCVDVPTLGYLVPAATSTNIFRQDAGISFAVRTEVFQQMKYEFYPSNWEDFLFLHALRKDKVPVLMSEHLAYYVKDFTIQQCLVPAERSYLTNQTTNLLLRGAASMTKEEIDHELKLAKIYECSRRGHGAAEPKFVFSEAQSIFFQHNIRGLQNSLGMAIKKRCHGYWRQMPDIDIHLVFGATTPPKSPFYIQVQLEQRDTFHFSVDYMKKLQGALQIWEFNQLGESSRKLPGVNSSIYFVPTMLMLDSKPVYHCAADHKAAPPGPKDLVGTSVPTFHVYQRGVYYKCHLGADGSVRSVDHELSPCAKKSTRLRAPYCFSSPTVITDAEERHKLCRETLFPPRREDGADATPIDALMFGALRNSSDNQRESTCDALTAAGLRVVCVEGIFDKLLSHLVCQARVVVVSHYFRTSALETHRIDPLLQIGKVVVATESLSSPDIDRLYRQVIPIVPSADLVRTVTHVVRNYHSWLRQERYTERVRDFVRRATTTIDPMCLAISQLETKIKGILENTTAAHQAIDNSLVALRSTDGLSSVVLFAFSTTVLVVCVLLLSGRCWSMAPLKLLFGRRSA